MRNFIFGVLFAGFFAVAGVAVASTVTGGASFDDVWTAIIDIRSDVISTDGDLSMLKLQLTAKAAQDALDKQAMTDALEALKNNTVVKNANGGIAHSEHYILQDAKFE